MSDLQPVYLSTMTDLRNTLYSERLGLSHWPTDLWQQEQRIAFFHTCFSEVEELLRMVAEDFDVIPPFEERKDRDDSIPTHTDMWLCMYEIAQSLTRADLSERFSVLRVDCTTKKTVEALRPIMVLTHKVLEDVSKRKEETFSKYAGIIEYGPRVSDEIANSARYVKWKRSYAVLKEVVELLQAALERINTWVTYKIFDMQMAKETESSKKGSAKNLKK